MRASARRALPEGLRITSVSVFWAAIFIRLKHWWGHGLRLDWERVLAPPDETGDRPYLTALVEVFGAAAVRRVSVQFNGRDGKTPIAEKLPFCNLAQLNRCEALSARVEAWWASSWISSSGNLTLKLALVSKNSRSR